MRKLLGPLILGALITVVGLACGGSGDTQEAVPTAIATSESTVISSPAPSENNEINALRSKLAGPCNAANTTEIFSATGLIIVYDWDVENYLGGFGTGLVFNGYVLTARHLIDKIPENAQPVIFIYVPSEGMIAPIRTNIVYSDSTYDFAVLELDDTSEIYEEARPLFDSFHVTTLNGEISNGPLCFFRPLYIHEAYPPSLVPLPGQYPAEVERFITEPGRDFSFDSSVGGPGASGSPVFVRSGTGELVLTGIITHGTEVDKLEKVGESTHQRPYENIRVLGIGFICKQIQENAGIDLCGSSE